MYPETLTRQGGDAINYPWVQVHYRLNVSNQVMLFGDHDRNMNTPPQANLQYGLPMIVVTAFGGQRAAQRTVRRRRCVLRRGPTRPARGYLIKVVLFADEGDTGGEPGLLEDTQTYARPSDELEAIGSLRAPVLIVTPHRLGLGGKQPRDQRPRRSRGARGRARAGPPTREEGRQRPRPHSHGRRPAARSPAATRRRSGSCRRVQPQDPGGRAARN